MAEKVNLSKFLKNMEFMKKGIQRKRELEEVEKAKDSGEMLDMKYYLHSKQNDDDGYLTTDSFLLCMDLRFGRFSYQNVNPEIEKLMSFNTKNNKNEPEPEAADEIDVTREEMARVLSNKRRRHHR